jgi:hypothetical protein
MPGDAVSERVEEADGELREVVRTVDGELGVPGALRCDCEVMALNDRQAPESARLNLSGSDYFTFINCPRRQIQLEHFPTLLRRSIV